MSLPLITRHQPDLSEWSLALESERALGFGRSLDGESTLDEERTLDRERTLAEPTDLDPVADLTGVTSPEVARRDVSFGAVDEWLLTTQHPHLCTRCGRYVHSGSMEIRVDRKVWVFCDKLCRLEWDAERLFISEARTPEPRGSRA